MYVCVFVEMVDFGASWRDDKKSYIYICVCVCVCVYQPFHTGRM